MQKEQSGSSADPRRKSSIHQLRSQRPLSHRALRGRRLLSLQNLFVEDLTRIPEKAHWNCVRKGKIHVLEIFAGSARFSQCCALTCLKVGAPVDIRNGFDVMTSKGRHLISSSWHQSVGHGQICKASNKKSQAHKLDALLTF